MDREDIRLEVRRLVKDTSEDATRQRWLNATINSRINYIQEDIVARTKCLIKRASSVNITSGTSEYSLTSSPFSLTDYLYPYRLCYLDSGSKWNKLRPITIEELDDRGGEWESDSGTPTNYYIRLEYIGLYPKPDASRSSALRLDYVARPTEISSDTTEPFNAEVKFTPLHYAICYGVAHLCLRDEEGDTSLIKADKMFKLYEAEITKGIKLISVIDKEEQPRLRSVYEGCRSKGRWDRGVASSPFNK